MFLRSTSSPLKSALKLCSETSAAPIWAKAVCTAAASLPSASLPGRGSGASRASCLASAAPLIPSKLSAPVGASRPDGTDSSVNIAAITAIGIRSSEARYRRRLIIVVRAGF